MKGILARKVGMTRVVDATTGQMVPVTVLEAPSSTVLQVKTMEKDGYSALVLGNFERKHFGKNENQKYKFVREIHVEPSEVKKGDKLGLEMLVGVEKVGLTGVSKGRGFAGVLKRHHFRRGPESHGSTHHREPGSVGMRAKPGAILKGKRLPGRMGTDTVTLRDVRVMAVQPEKNLIAVKGPVPGAINGYIFITAL